MSQLKTTPIDEFRAYDGTLSLICRKCGKTGDYEVGRLCVNPDTHDGDLELDDRMSYSGLFRCRKCRAPGPWELTDQAKLTVAAQIMLAKRFPSQAQIVFGKLALFDGTISRSGAESEDYIKQRIAENPGDYYVWSRLGNLYKHAGYMDQAIPAYEKAIDLNPADMESHYALGCHCLYEGERQPAIAHFRAIVTHCRTTQRNPDLCRGIVADTLRNLIKLEGSLAGALIALPGGDAEPERTTITALSRLEPSDDDIDNIVTYFLTGTLLQAKRQRQAPATPPKSFKRPGRNDRCPCGSGRKFKQCCMAKRP